METNEFMISLSFADFNKTKTSPSDMIEVLEAKITSILKVTSQDGFLTLGPLTPSDANLITETVETVYHGVSVKKTEKTVKKSNFLLYKEKKEEESKRKVFIAPILEKEEILRTRLECYRELESLITHNNFAFALYKNEKSAKDIVKMIGQYYIEGNLVVIEPVQTNEKFQVCMRYVPKDATENDFDLIFKSNKAQKWKIVKTSHR